MNLVFSKSNWEMGESPLEIFLKKTKESGFDTAEIYLLSVKEKPYEIASLHRKYGLKLTAQILTDGRTPKEHINSFEQQFKRSLDGRARVGPEGPERDC